MEMAGWSAGSPEPFIISSEQRTFVGFFTSDDDSRPSGSGAVVVIELTVCTSMKFGFPNDEALHGHVYVRSATATTPH